MTMMDDLITEAKRCYRDPRLAARNVLDLGVPREALMPAFGFVVAISVIMRTLFEQTVGIEAQGSVLSNAVMVGIAIAVHAACIWKIGEMMGGVGKLHEALLIDIFLQIALLPVLLVFGVLFSIEGAAAMLLALVAILFATWVNLCFVDVLHRFESLMKSIGLILFAAFVSMVLVGILSIPLVLATTGGSV